VGANYIFFSFAQDLYETFSYTYTYIHSYIFIFNLFFWHNGERRKNVIICTFNFGSSLVNRIIIIIILYSLGWIFL
jgi:hypothetical protein